MELTRENLESLVRDFTVSNGNKQGWMIFLGDHLFVSTRQKKKIFAKKAHALSSLRACVEWPIKGMIRKQLIDNGIPSDEVYKYYEYQHAWDNFIKNGTKSGFIQIVELNGNSLYY